MSKYYQNDKEKLQNKKLEKYIKFFLKNKKKKTRQYGRERCKNLPDNEKQKLVEYRKKYYEKNALS